MSKVWYVVYVKPRNEKKVALRLEERGFEVYCPLIKEVRQWSDRKKTVNAPLFKSYVFVRLAKGERSQVFDFPGVIRYLFWLGKPAVVRDSEMQELKQWLSNDSVEDYKLTPFSPGDRVTIQYGIMKDRQAVVKEVGKTRARLFLKGLGVVLNMKLKYLDKNN
ncbi:UpxY family transcription antiterminator [Maribacter sp. 2307ULW6-5]|uniref:UpxY family transcription antiterminator n=1 Tax=Maribacter sp. 2307ULW6-5 TaxID=3386275 RepID=UPI0039BC68FD